MVSESHIKNVEDFKWMSLDGTLASALTVKMASESDVYKLHKLHYVHMDIHKAIFEILLQS